jgi:hypothetical protein
MRAAVKWTTPTSRQRRGCDSRKRQKEEERSEIEEEEFAVYD